MKKGFLVLLIVASLWQAKAQDKVQYGLTGNISLNNYSGNGLSSKLYTGGDIGIFAAIPLHKKWSLQPELLLSYKPGARTDNFIAYYVNEGRSSSVEGIKTSYISLPILVNYKLSNHFTINAGPQAAFLVYRDENLLNGTRSAFKKWDGGVTAGLQYELVKGFQVFGSYYYGLLNINNIDDRYKWYNRSIKLGINVSLF